MIRFEFHIYHDGNIWTMEGQGARQGGDRLEKEDREALCYTVETNTTL